MSKSRLSEGLKRAQSRLTKTNSKKILNNVFLLYLVLLISISDLLYMAGNGDYVNVGVFVLAGYITSMFSKNMMVIMLVALAITNIYALGKSIVVKEGLTVEGAEDKNEEEIDIDAKLKEENEKEKKEEEESKKKHKKQHKDMDDEAIGEGFDKEAMTGDEKLPTGFKDALSKLENPETRKTIEGLKELAPMIEQMGKMIDMMK